MSDKLWVSQREIDYPAQEVFVSKTDSKGVITYANDAFIKISGYSSQELIGANHNLVRHPDMPKWAFANLWQTIQGGYPWRGCVKNRAKNGDHYWVRANISPVINHGKVVGYLSLRKKPSREEIAAAEALYRSPNLPRRHFSIARWFCKLPLQNKLQVLLQPVLLLVMGAAAFYVADHGKTRLIETVQERADAIADKVIDSMNMLMLTGQISLPETRQLLIKKIASSGHIVSLQLARSDSVVLQFGAGLPEEKVRDEEQRRVIADKKTSYRLIQRGEQTLYRVITPYLFSHNFHSTDCLTCHVAEEGSVAGVSDIEIDMTKDFKEQQTFMTLLNVGQVLFQILLFFFIGGVVKHFVTRRVIEIRSHLADLVQGDMSGPVNISGRDEMGSILCAVQSSNILLGSMVDQITSVSGNIDARAKHLAFTMSEVEKSSHSQSASALDMAVVVEMMNVNVDQIASNAKEVSQISEHSTTLANNGEEVVQQVVADMKKINTAVSKAAHLIDDLGHKSAQIQNFVTVIQDVAEQTNLLALNAAIEAARAGEQGRGFAVVADEVRKLAEKTGKSTKEISLMTQSIIGSTHVAVAEMKAVVASVKAGTTLAEQAGAAIIEINSGSLRVLNGVKTISSAIHEQSLAGHQIAENVEKVAQTSEESSTSVKEISSTVEKLEHLSQTLEESVKHFRV